MYAAERVMQQKPSSLVLLIKEIEQKIKLKQLNATANCVISSC